MSVHERKFMNKSARFYLCLGAFFSFLSVMIGAFGAHALKPLISVQMMAVFNTAVQYQMFHALALFIVGLLLHIIVSNDMQAKRFRLVGNLFLVGIVLFCGSLYLLAITGVKILGAITPFGGLAFILGWLVLLYALYRSD
jgi:uncharacterized membrane protein YgdD (TMEM256/DUF423 family)